MNIDFVIPPSLLKWLDQAPADRPVALLLRHSVRDDLPPGDAGYVLPITPIGRQLAQSLGGLLGARLRTLHTSPLVRCVQTAEALRDGARVAIDVVPDRLLGDPGVYVLDDREAGRQWDRLGHERVMSHLVSASEGLPGMATPQEAARYLVQHLLAVAGDTPGVHVFVTHDSLVTTTAARMLGVPLGPDAWPWYLEGTFFWRDTLGLRTAYRDHHTALAAERLCGLDEAEVLDWARREIARSVGLDCGARFFLAGGAFKSLLTGRAPRDLDLWAPSVADRAELIATLERRGARRLRAQPFAEAFEIDERVVEVPNKTEPATLAERLARFDIGLSAIGVEHRPAGAWSVVVHPLAVESVERREVLLLKPLVNWRHVLSTLGRLRRYALELGFRVPPEEEDEVWRVFDAQTAEVRASMLQAYGLTEASDPRIGEEAACRHR